MKWFRGFNVWAMNAKLFMALYFIVMVFALGAVTLVNGGDSISLLTLLEMLFTCAAVAALQAWLLSDSTDYSHGVLFGRSLAWLLLSTLVSAGAALLFGWFAVVTYLLSVPALNRRFQKAGHWIDRILGGAMVLLGIRVVAGR